MSMNWKRLANNHCPICNKPLDFDSNDEYLLCDISCGFQISHKRFKEICASQTTYRLERENNQDLLNEIGGDNSLHDYD